MKRPRPLKPERLRTIERPFGWIPFRILTSGILPQLSTQAKLLYFLLCLVADRYGISFYGDYRLTVLLKLSGYEFRQARDELLKRDLLAYDGKVYQLLSLPPRHQAQPVGVPACRVRDANRRTRTGRSSPPNREKEESEHIGEILRKLGLGG